MDSVPTDLSTIQALDRDDPLAGFRAEFELPDDVVYLDGNSLGALPKAARAIARRTVEEEWSTGLVRSWNDAGWITLAQAVGAKIAGLIGARANEVIACDSTSVNLFKLLAAALARDPSRRVILTNQDNFPTDAFVADGLARWLGGGAEFRAVADADVLDALDAQTAVLALTHVDYRTGALWDMAAVTRAAQEAGAVAFERLVDGARAYGAEDPYSVAFRAFVMLHGAVDLLRSEFYPRGVSNDRKLLLDELVDSALSILQGS